jgi:hypothetical protein
MLNRTLIVCAIVAAAGLGAFAATGFGERDASPAELTATALDTHAVGAPPAGAPGVERRRASLFKILYRTTDPVSAPAGYSSYTLEKCPKGAGVINGFHVRTGSTKTGVRAAGTFPDGVRKWTYVIENVNGVPVDVRFGLICLK